MKYLPFLLLFFIYACNDSLRDKQKELSRILDNVDRIEVLYIDKSDTIRKVEESKREIERFKDLCYRKPVENKTDTTGVLNFLAAGKVVFEAWFSTKGTGGKTTNASMLYTLNKINYTVLIGKETEMYLDNIYHTQKK